MKTLRDMKWGLAPKDVELEALRAVNKHFGNQMHRLAYFGPPFYKLGALLRQAFLEAQDEVSSQKSG
jgi:hypothetical protein